MIAQEAVIAGGIFAFIGVPEEAEETFVVRQMKSRGQLQFEQGDMSRIEIDGDNLGGGGRQIVHDVAAARSDRDDALVRAEFQCCHVDGGVFPDLRIDQAGEGKGKQAFENALPAGQLVGMHRVCQKVLGFLLAHGSVPVSRQVEVAPRVALRPAV